MKHSPHTMLSALLVVAVYVLVAARADLLALACALTVGATLWMVVRPNRR
jgi:hypothetical protein